MSALKLLALLLLVCCLCSCGQTVPPPSGEKTDPIEPELAAEPDSFTLTSPPRQLSDDELQQGWVSLFDGETLFGWEPTSQVNWRVIDGVIIADKGEAGFLMTAVPFADYEFRCEFRAAKGGNSGVFLRTARQPKSPAVDCYELNICDTHPEFKTGGLVARAKPDQDYATDGEWHAFHVTLQGPQVTVRLDGKEILNYTDATEKPLQSGYIGLQFREGQVEFRKLFLKPLGLQPLFNGKDLAGWRRVPGSNGVFEWQADQLHVTGGRGFLETEQTWGDFVFQAEVKTNGEALNSGFFFRAEPGTEQAPSNGYELQIHNGVRDGDLNQPVDWGTGGLFKRVAARRVNAEDREWFRMTLVASGDRFATWVNGLPVVSWQDTRGPHDNPREGLRIAPGHISVQAHDPTTDIDFRTLQIAPLPPVD